MQSHAPIRYENMENKKLLSLSIIFLFINNFNHVVSVITIDQGTLTGMVSMDRTYTMYLGIPYATMNDEYRFQASKYKHRIQGKPLRFKGLTPPMPPTKWNGVFNAVKPSSSCLQLLSPINIVVGEEDCLKINVYVPSTVKKPLPVMVFVHGGEYRSGSGAAFIYGPEFLIKHDVILVTFNYRLGVLGFLCLGIKEAPGNAGLKDQVAALQWVKKNIGAFGGDPDNITIFGESAGAKSVSLLMLSNMTQGLFHKAILQSGSSLANWALNQKPILAASLVAKEFGHDTENAYDLYNILSQIPAKDLISKSPINLNGSYFDNGKISSACVEKHIQGVEPFITDLPYNIIQNKARDIPVIIGTNSKEGYLAVSSETDKSLEELNAKYALSSDLEFNSDELALNESEAIKKFYFGNNRISRSMLMNLTDLYTHLLYEVPAQIEGEIITKNIESPVYRYYFNYSGGRNFLKKLLGFGNEPGACHTDELPYLFDPKLWPFPIKDKDQKVIDWMTKLWTNFAKYGDPTPEHAEDNPIKWQPYKDNMELLYIEDELKMDAIPNPEATSMWKDLYNKYRRREAINY